MEKHSMRHLLWAALFLLYCSCGCLAAVVQQLPQKGESALQAYTVSDTPKNDDKNGPEWQPIRIAVYTKTVEDIMNNCEKTLKEYNKLKEELQKELEGELEGEFEEKVDDPEAFLEVFEDEIEQLKRLCRGNDRMTEDKKKVLFTEVLPKAIKLHTDRLKVNHEERKTISSVGEQENFNIGCHFFKNPLKLKVHQSEDFDFMIYVGLSTSGKTVEICTQENENGRPTSAAIRFIPDEIKATRQFIRFTAHEIAHGLGFQLDLMKTLGMIKTRDNDLFYNPVVVEKKYYMVNSSKTVEMMEKHYNCKGTLKGLYLENEDTLTPSHWERRIAKDELMSTYSISMGVTGMYYTNLTLAAFHSMPFYSANFTMAEPMSWGKGSECDLLEGKKDPAKTKYSTLFCKDDDAKTLRCTSDRFALGMCLTKNNLKDLPNGYEYFKDEDGGLETNDLMDSYPIIKPLIGTTCEGGKETLIPGSVLGTESRCLDVKNPLDKNGVKIQGICAKVKCNNETKKVSVLKGYKENKEEWHECANDGDEFHLVDSEFNEGSVNCPKYEEVCIGLLETEVPTNIKFHNGTKVTDVYDGDVSGGNEEKEEVVENQDRTDEEKPPASLPTAPNGDLVENEKVPTENGNNETVTEKEPEDTVSKPQVPPTTSEEKDNEKVPTENGSDGAETEKEPVGTTNTSEVPPNREEEEEKENENNETVVAPGGDGATTEEESEKHPTDKPTGPSDESNENVSNSSSGVPPNTEDLPQGESPQETETPSNEVESSKPESPDNNGTTNNGNGQNDHNTGKDADNSITLSFFEPLMLLVCVVAAVVAL
ncbi:surface protease GP63 [Trypanosoma theileri]|uniref:Leishmanolysin-like peptidase n=1 Tax=Trypanosoma theileri TaxID=67003 RepID=A0A1X0NFU4_9TRYP|nr:surface protease GP63 [Trypanosoma theileri]ORC83624.1 surface protease GP63 [Trypanosoma theileri]